MSYDDQLWLFAIKRGNRLFADQPLSRALEEEWVLYDLMSMGTFDWTGLHRPTDATTRSMRYAAALVECQAHVLQAEQHKVPSPPAHNFVSRLTRGIGDNLGSPDEGFGIVVPAIP